MNEITEFLESEDFSKEDQGKGYLLTYDELYELLLKIQIKTLENI